MWDQRNYSSNIDYINSVDSPLNVSRNTTIFDKNNIDTAMQNILLP